MGNQFLGFPGDLDGQLTGRLQHHDAGVLDLGWLPQQAVQRWQKKGQCLTGACLGATDDIAFLQARWNGLDLDRGQFLISQGSDCLLQRWAEI